MSQLSLFPNLSLVSTRPVIPAPRRCCCGGLMATLSSSRGPHAGELRCADCGSHLMWASHGLATEIRRGFVTGISTFAPGCAP
jgi:hypothetical protein